MDADLKKPFSRAVAFAGKKNFMLNKLNADFFSLEILESEKLEEIVVKKTTRSTTVHANISLKNISYKRFADERSDWAAK